MITSGDVAASSGTVNSEVVGARSAVHGPSESVSNRMSRALASVVSIDVGSAGQLELPVEAAYVAVRQRSRGRRSLALVRLRPHE
ncbi:hypothetical protein ABIB15_002203 [Marisediminicola sp. UYEF4]|uniref:hypothetical protein n=1 Tax=Marisediminicola sp. UYEF4 TaxID=1756384 RepID=UPI00339843B9